MIPIWAVLRNFLADWPHDGFFMSSPLGPRIREVFEIELKIIGCDGSSPRNHCRLRAIIRLMITDTHREHKPILNPARHTLMDRSKATSCFIRVLDQWLNPLDPLAMKILGEYEKDVPSVLRKQNPLSSIDVTFFTASRSPGLRRCLCQESCRKRVCRSSSWAPALDTPRFSGNPPLTREHILPSMMWTTPANPGWNAQRSWPILKSALPQWAYFSCQSISERVLHVVEKLVARQALSANSPAVFFTWPRPCCAISSRRTPSPAPLTELHASQSRTWRWVRLRWEPPQAILRRSQGQIRKVGAGRNGREKIGLNVRQPFSSRLAIRAIFARHGLVAIEDYQFSMRSRPGFFGPAVKDFAPGHAGPFIVFPTLKPNVERGPPIDCYSIRAPSNRHIRFYIRTGASPRHALSHKLVILALQSMRMGE